MAFMQKQITEKQNWLCVETTQGTEWLPVDLVGDIEAGSIDSDEGSNDDFNTLQQYCDGEPQSWETATGYGARMSALGYMDCTEWTVFDTVLEAENYLEEYYGDEESEDEEIL